MPSEHPTQLPEALSLAVEHFVPELGLDENQEAVLARVLLSISAEARLARNHLATFVDPGGELSTADEAAIVVLDAARMSIGAVAARWLQYQHGRTAWEPGQASSFVERFELLAQDLGV